MMRREYSHWDSTSTCSYGTVVSRPWVCVSGSILILSSRTRVFQRNHPSQALVLRNREFICVGKEKGVSKWRESYAYTARLVCCLKLAINLLYGSVGGPKNLLQPLPGSGKEYVCSK
jgi:hypothetical protein